MKKGPFSVASPPSTTIRATAYNQLSVKDPLANMMERSKVYANELLSILLYSRGKPYTLDSISHDEKDIEKQLKKYHRPFKSKISFPDFKRALCDFYEVIVTSKGNPTNSLYNILFSPNDSIKLTIMPEHTRVLREIGFFPILINGEALEVGLNRSVTKQVVAKIMSFEEIQKAYDEEKEHFNKVLTSKSATLPHLSRYSEFLMKLSEDDTFDKFAVKHYRRLIKACRSKKYKNGDCKEGMVAFFHTCDESTVFIDDDKFRFGYAPSVMNLLFNEFEDLWKDENIIGSEEYVSLIEAAFHWNKDHVFISSFGAAASGSKAMPISFGNNTIPFKIENNDGQFYILTKNTKDNTPLKIIISKSIYFDKHTTISEGSTKGTYSIRYTSDSKHKTWYLANIKEFNVRYAGAKIRIDFTVSHTRDEKCDIDLNGRYASFKEGMNSNRLHLQSVPSNGRSKEVYEFGLTDFNTLSVDLGLLRPIAYTVHNVKFQDGRFKSASELANGFSIDSVNNEARLKKINEVSDKILATRACITFGKKYIRDHFHGKEGMKIGSIYYSNGRTIKWAHQLGIDVDKYEAILDSICIDSYEESCKALKRNDGYIGELLCSSMSDLKHNIGEFRQEYFNHKDKRSYCVNENKIDASKFFLRRLVLDFIALNRSFSHLGCTEKESDRFNNKSFCSTYYKWLEGLARFCSNNIASNIVNIARENNCKVIFIEDLDSRTTAFDSSEQNKVKSLWCVGEIMKFLATKSKKHNIAVVMVDPDNTSQVHNATGLFGYRNKRDLIVPIGNEVEVVDSDINASRNIFSRGISRHTDYRVFSVDQIGKEMYRLDLTLTGKRPSKSDENGDDKKGEKRPVSKRRSASLYESIGSRCCIFKDNGGHLEIVKTKLSKKDESLKKINDKSVYAILDGDIWRLGHERKAELKELFGESDKIAQTSSCTKNTATFAESQVVL